MSGGSNAAAEERSALAAVARELGDLLLIELDRDRLERLASVSEALREVGIDPPGRGADLDGLAADYHDAVVRPTGPGAPPIASLWTEGRFEGGAAARMRELARSAALEHDATAALGAPIDHLGCILHLWARAVERAPWVATEIESQWLAWADAPLARVEASGGFYGDVARATRSFARELGAGRAEGD